MSKFQMKIVIWMELMLKLTLCFFSLVKLFATACH